MESLILALVLNSLSGFDLHGVAATSFLFLVLQF